MSNTNRNDRQAVILITGTSSGIGKATAEHLALKGFKVYGASRQIQPSNEHLIPIQMDVRDDRSVKNGVQNILTLEDRIDILINNAGVGYAGSIEDSSIDEVKAQFETNFFGTFRLCKEVLPVMREQKKGLIINMSSIMGLIGLPFQGLYSASKFAIEGLTEGLRLEVKRLGIHVTLLEPGDFKTHFFKNRIKTKKSYENAAYNQQFERVLSVIELNEMNAPLPDVVAAKIHQIITSKRPKPRYKVGNSLEKMAPVLKNILPYHLYENILSAYYRQ